MYVCMLLAIVCFVKLLGFFVFKENAIVMHDYAHIYIHTEIDVDLFSFVYIGFKLKGVRPSTQQKGLIVIQKRNNKSTIESKIY